jgi:hypothetical protein
MMKAMNKILAIPAAAAAIPKKPKIPAIMATIKNTTAQPSMISTTFLVELFDHDQLLSCSLSI